MKNCEKNIIERYYNVEGSNYLTADQIAMAAALNESVIKNVVKAACMVEIQGPLTRGQCGVDWSGRHFKDKPKINIIKELHHDIYQNMLMNGLKGKP